MKKFFVFLLFLAAFNCGFHSPNAAAQANSSTVQFPFVGAQVFIEPGQTPQEIDGWFKTLKENNFQVCRIRMFEAYMTKENGERDFSLFDNAFRSAEKYGIKIFGTIFPRTEKTDIGGFKFPSDNDHLNSIAMFIRDLVSHYKNFSSLYGWVLINEPGTGGRVPWTDLTKSLYADWKKDHPQKEFSDNGYPVLVDLGEQEFLYDLNTWYLKWLAGEVRKNDRNHEIHVNNHAMFQNCSEYNFPEWRKFLTSMGGSAHAAWHFGYFTRQQYAMAMSANSEIVRSGAGDLPWFMTELQGGNNTYSGGAPMCPTKEEISQWLWIIYATEGNGGIFWTLNPRSSGIEAGEWAMLDFQGKPSDRMTEAKNVAETLIKNRQLILNSREAESGINILYVRQSLWAESKMASGSAQNYEARKTGGVMKSALGYFETLSQMGLNSNLKAFEEFDFSKDDYSGTTIILAHQISVPGDYARVLKEYVRKGGKLIIDGLTAFFDENLQNTMNTGFDYAEVFGGNISEFRLVDNIFNIRFNNHNIPAHLWQGFLINGTGKPAATDDEGRVVALRNTIGRGEVLWLPSLLGLGSRLSGDYNPLAGLLAEEIHSMPVPKFRSFSSNILMKTLVSGQSFITVVVNKSNKQSEVAIDFPVKKNSGHIIYANKKGTVTGTSVRISPEETIVIDWK